MQQDQQAVRLDIGAAGVATIIFSQPDRGNPIDGDVCRQFKDIVNQLWTTKPLRAVLIRAEGKNFSVGGDIKSFTADPEQLPALIDRWTGDLHYGLSRLWQLPVPVVAQIQGWAMGGAVGLLAGADIVVCGQSARFGSAFTQIGFSCDSGSSITLSMRMGAARARRFTLLAEILSSSEALACGLVDQVVPDQELGACALALAEQLAAGPTLAYGEIKRLFLRAGAAQMKSQLDDEAQTLTRIAASADARGALAAFVAKRPFAFAGN